MAMTDETQDSMGDGTHDPVEVIAYGDADTVVNHQSEVTERAENVGLLICGWYSDPEGLRDVEYPADAPGMVEALADCGRLNRSLLIPYLVDVPGENHWRLIGHWLHNRGLKVFLSGNEYCWCCASDPIDWALRRQLDAASDLAAAIVATGALPSIDQLLEEIVNG
jgi:hypothetical protein